MCVPKFILVNVVRHEDCNGQSRRHWFQGIHGDGYGGEKNSESLPESSTPCCFELFVLCLLTW